MGRLFAPFTPDNSSATCQPIASPSRSGSVATKTSDTFCAASFSSLRTFLRLAMGSYTGTKPSSTSTPSLLFGRSRMCPIEAMTL